MSYAGLRTKAPEKSALKPKTAPSAAPSGLRIGDPNDVYEREADRVADEVMSVGAARRHWSLSTMRTAAPLRRKCSCGGSAGSTGECEECKQKKEEPTVQRKAAGIAGPAFAPPIVHEVLNSPGRPLDQATRDFFEPKFEQDLSSVRLHTGAPAAQSASQVKALAYTVGHDVVFADRQFAPNSKDGMGLLAHELAHVIQQGQGPDVLQRYAEAEPDVEEEVEEETEETPSGRHAAPPSPYSLRGRIEAHRRAQTEDDLTFEMELPASTTQRGGSAAANFQEEKPKQTTSAATQSGTVTVQYTPTVFHMLDAMEADIARAQTSEDILDIYLAYFRESAAMLAPRATSGTRLPFRTFADKIPLFHVPPEQADPDGTERTTVFVTAVKRRTDIDPKLSTDATLEAIIRGFLQHEAQQEQAVTARLGQNQGPCQTRAIPRKGGNKDHDDYATEVTGQNTDFEVTAPGGLKCAFDGQDVKDPKVVWEVKTRHEWSTPQGIPSGIFSPRIQDAILKMESQLERCKGVAQRCGYQYKWAFENKSAAEFMSILWRGHVVVVHRPRAGGGPG
jgi:hypothetical protein